MQNIILVSPEGSVEVTPLNNVFNFQDTVTFNCSSLGGLNNTITWSMDGQQLLGETEPELTITNISSIDGGTYQCEVSNSAGSEQIDTILFVLPYFVEDPVDILAANGSIDSFSCLAEAFPNVTYVWLRTNGQDVRSNIDGRTNSILTFNPVIFGDEGQYFCEANSSNVTRSSLSALLTGKVGSTYYVELHLL